MEIWSRAVVLDLLNRDVWDLAEVRTDSGVALIRYRTPVLVGRNVEGLDRVLKVVWAFAAEGAGAMPSNAQSEQMGVFEDRFCQAVEHDGHAVLTAVLTFDGARQHRSRDRTNGRPSSTREPAKIECGRQRPPTANRAGSG